MRWALMVLLMTAVAGDEGAEKAGNEGAEEEGDGAPFMVLVSEAGGAGAGGRAGVLVSAHTALTCGACARGERLEVRSAAGGEGRRVARVFEPLGGGGPAVLELEQPLPEAARAGPIVMAAAAGECAVGAACNLVRLLLAPRPHLRIVDATLAPPDTCRAVSAVGTELCLTGQRLCEVDRGTGVVCGGKLCGVLARSAPDDSDSDSDSDVSDSDASEGAACGALHAAHSLVRRRKFIHCAHTLRNCGRGDCAEVCTERYLLATRSPPPPSRAPHDVTPRRTSPAAPPRDRAAPSRAPPLPPAPSRAAPPALDTTTTDRPVSARPTIEWVQARDYIEYGGDERQPPPSTTSSTSPSPPPSPPPPPPPALAAAAPAPSTNYEPSLYVPEPAAVAPSEPLLNTARPCHETRALFTTALMLLLFNTAR